MTQDHPLTAMLVPFYLGEQPDLSGRNIQEIWGWDFETLECVHDYIQWLFPISEKSAFNPNAPIACQATVQAFQRDSRLQHNLQQSLSVMLRFYGLKRSEAVDGKKTIECAEDYSIRKLEWVWSLNHNYLRITRILKCLMLFGLQDEAEAFYACLRQIYQEDGDEIGGETFQYWTNAVKINVVANP